MNGATNRPEWVNTLNPEWLNSTIEMNLGMISLEWSRYAKQGGWPATIEEVGNRFPIRYKTLEDFQNNKPLPVFITKSA